MVMNTSGQFFSVSVNRHFSSENCSICGTKRSNFTYLMTLTPRYLTDMGMSFNVRKCAYTTTTRIFSIMASLDPDNAVAPSVCLVAKGGVPYVGLRLDPTGIASMKHIPRGVPDEWKSVQDYTPWAQKDAVK